MASLVFINVPSACSAQTFANIFPQVLHRDTSDPWQDDGGGESGGFDPCKDRFALFCSVYRLL